ncbi:Uncharacterized protein PECH_007309 [Penicillium ucsense]|uniref:Fibroin-3 related protein n=1 Tax=Penicillium ucsense TaxID=2839758 RepID=A0A8J8W1X8_9EURO|nr:Uncharacterized protein PECM_007854 [Penicillium ucsense]KAF7734944.1 Uncharacterized protein PECH_007309 [Penicillium ucsense]
MSPPGLAQLVVRNVASDLESVPATFSSWDKCMTKAYCKWPVIAGIIIGAVILISVIGCIVNCLCCGYQCCKCCCGCCCPSGRRREKRPKHYDEPAPYQPPPPQNPHTAYQPPSAPPIYRGASQTATFDSSSKSPAVNEDALPAMPTWAAAVEKHVEDKSHHDEMELEPLNSSQNTPNRSRGASPLHTNHSSSDVLPDRSRSNAGYAGIPSADPYARPSPGSTTALSPVQDPYGRRSPGNGMLGTPRGADSYARTSPGPQPTIDPYSRQSPGPPAAYGPAQDPYARRSPGVTSPLNGNSSSYLYNNPAQQDRRQQGYNQQSYGQDGYNHQDYNNRHQQPYDDYNQNTTYQGAGSSTPVSTYPTQSSTHPTASRFAQSPDQAHPDPVMGDFHRQPSFGSSQYLPTYTSHAASPPPPFQSTAPSEYGFAVTEPSRERPPSLLQSGRKPVPNTYRNV